jgi:CheY-like chemotaxis protein
MLRQAAFLLVEDNEDDILLFKRAFSTSNVANPLQVVKNGHEALCYLEGSGRYRNRNEFPLPSLVLLDLKLPGIDGFEVLSWIRQHPSLRTLRVIVLTSSDEIRDVNRAYQLGANSFLVKPMALEDLNRLTQAISGYWIWFDKAPETSVASEMPGGSRHQGLR